MVISFMFSSYSLLTFVRVSETVKLLEDMEAVGQLNMDKACVYPLNAS